MLVVLCLVGVMIAVFGLMCFVFALVLLVTWVDATGLVVSLDC